MQVAPSGDQSYSDSAPIKKLKNGKPELRKVVTMKTLPEAQRTQGIASLFAETNLTLGPTLKTLPEAQRTQGIDSLT